MEAELFQTRDRRKGEARREVFGFREISHHRVGDLVTRKKIISALNQLGPPDVNPSDGSNG